MSYDTYPLQSQPKKRAPRNSRWLAALSLLNLVLVLLLAGAHSYGSEDWWLSMILVYLPKSPFLIPGGVLFLCCCVSRSKWLFANALSVVLVAGPMMGLVMPLERLQGHAPAAQPDDLRIVSCNIQGFQPSFPTVVAELKQYAPEIVVFQEVRGDDHPLLESEFKGWHVVRKEYYWVGSKYPLRLVRTLDAQTFDRSAGILVEIDLPTGTIQLADIHLMTARRSLAEISLSSMIRGEAQSVIGEHQAAREVEMQEVRHQIDEQQSTKPLIVLGDFNTPSSSSLYQRGWGDLQNAFDLVGFGFGYTSPCSKHTHWFENTPWVRIDHILCTHEWSIISCEIGSENGSDHRLITATIRLRDLPATLKHGRDSTTTTTATP